MSNKTAYMVSHYIGEPSVGIAKASGTLKLESDRIVFEIVTGNAIGNLGGLATMLYARKKARENGASQTFMLSDIEAVRETRYMAAMPMLTLDLKNGETHSFAGFFSASEWCSDIKRLKPSINATHHSAAAKSTSGKAPAANRPAQQAAKPSEAVRYVETNDDSFVAMWSIVDQKNAAERKVVVRFLKDHFEMRDFASSASLMGHIPYAKIQKVAYNPGTLNSNVDVTFSDGDVYRFVSSAETARKAAERFQNLVNPAAGQAASPKSDFTFYFEGEAGPGPKQKGVLTVQADHLAFAIEDDTYLQFPFEAMVSADAGQFMERWPMLNVVMKDGADHHFFKKDLQASYMAAVIKEKIEEIAATRSKKRICKHCGHTYEDGDTFCTECGGLETL